MFWILKDKENVLRHGYDLICNVFMKVYIPRKVFINSDIRIMFMSKSNTKVGLPVTGPYKLVSEQSSRDLSILHA